MGSFCYYIGIDIGATLVKAGIVTRDGKLVEKAELETREIKGPAHFVSLCDHVIGRLLDNRALDKHSIGGIGVGAPGWVDYFNGVVKELTNIPDWTDVPLADDLERKTGLKSFVDNDANVMAVAELLHGAGRGRKNFICLTLGTGVGGAIVINGGVYRGAHGLAGEIGHMTLDMEGPVCACGAKGCLESYVGNRFIVANAVKRLEQDFGSAGESILRNMVDNKIENLSPKILADAANRGDPIAIAVWRDVGYRLGTALAVLVNLLNPECFIIGGGVARAGAILFDEMRNTTESLAMNHLGKETPILEAELAADAGVIGAATIPMLCIE